MPLTNDLRWRYATKKRNGQPVPQEKLDYILEAARLAPPSPGVQPYKIFVISNREKLQQLKVIANNQNQITQCSHLLVFAAQDHYSFERMTPVFARIAEERGMEEHGMKEYRQRLWQKYSSLGLVKLKKVRTAAADFITPMA